MFYTWKLCCIRCLQLDEDWYVKNKKMLDFIINNDKKPVFDNEGHLLYKIIVDYYPSGKDMYCNKCLKNINISSKKPSWSCETCNYDLCDKCFKKESIKKDFMIQIIKKVKNSPINENLRDLFENEAIQALWWLKD